MEQDWQRLKLSEEGVVRMGWSFRKSLQGQVGVEGTLKDR